MENNVTYFKCSNCNKELKKGEQGYSECSECRYHQDNNTRTIPEYNNWLRKGKEEIK